MPVREKKRWKSKDFDKDQDANGAEDGEDEGRALENGSIKYPAPSNYSIKQRDSSKSTTAGSGSVNSSSSSISSRSSFPCRPRQSNHNLFQQANFNTPRSFRNNGFEQYRHKNGDPGFAESTGRTFHTYTRMIPVIITGITFLLFFGIASFFIFHAHFTPPSSSQLQKPTEIRQQQQQRALRSFQGHQSENRPNSKSSREMMMMSHYSGDLGLNLTRSEEQRMRQIQNKLEDMSQSVAIPQSQGRVQGRYQDQDQGSNSESLAFSAPASIMSPITAVKLIEEGLLDLESEDLRKTRGHPDFYSQDEDEDQDRNLSDDADSKQLLHGNHCFIPASVPEEPHSGISGNMVQDSESLQNDQTCEQTQLNNYGIGDLKDCCYQIIAPDGSLKDATKKEELWKTLVCTPFNPHDKDAMLTLQNNNEFLKLQCKSFIPKGALINNSISNRGSKLKTSLVMKTEFLANVPLKSKVVRDKIQYWIEQRENLGEPSSSTPVGSTLRPMNVLILGLDSTSRWSFRKFFPKSGKLLKDLGFVDMRGYHIVGGKTLDNLVPLLMGVPRSKLLSLCNHRWKSSWDDCPFIWKKFSDAHYVTMYAEDLPDSFNYGGQSGFEQKPTDFYLRPLLLQKSEFDGDVRCFGNVSTPAFILNYVQKFMNKFHSFLTPFFGFTWLNVPQAALSTKSTTIPKRLEKLDEALRMFLKRLRANKIQRLLENTLIVLVSDHGIQNGQRRQNLAGFLDHRLPILYIRPPTTGPQNRTLNQFTARFYPDIKNFLESNSLEISTPFDLHSSLDSILHGLHQDSEFHRGSGKIRKYIGPPFEKTTSLETRGVNLFTTALNHRGCEEANIDFHWCCCNISVTHGTTDRDIYQLVEEHELVPIVLQKLNDMAAVQRKSLLSTKRVKARTCPEMTFNRILYLGYHFAAPKKNTTGFKTSFIIKNQKYETLVLGVQVTPGHAQFEVFLVKEEEKPGKPGKWSVALPVIRIDSNAGYIFCVNH